MAAVATYYGAGVGQGAPSPQPPQVVKSAGTSGNAEYGSEIIEDKRSRLKNGAPARYRRGKLLGKGGFAKCYEATDMDTMELFAVKIVAKASISKPRAHEKLKSEIAIHNSLSHEGVVKFYNYFDCPEYVYIILELCPSQTLNEFMKRRPNKRLSEAETMFYLYDLIVALKYLHRRRVLHRDLKLGNLFLDADARLKVGDFGLAAQLEHDGEKKRTICGTPNYIAPEIIEGKHGHSYEVDIWSLGVIMYTMLFGRPPFDTSDVKTTYRRIRYNQYSFPEGVSVSSQAKDLITDILKTDPRSRPSCDDILTSPWFQGSRLPPPAPLSVVNFAAATPRPAVGNASARSETPDGCRINFGRIDSPATGGLRDRSPSCGLTPNPEVVAQPLGQHNGSLSSRGLNSNKALNTPGRCPSGGLKSYRPPLATRGGNDENIMPQNQISDGYQTNKMGGGLNSPGSKRTILGSQTFGNEPPPPPPPPPRAAGPQSSPLMPRSDSHCRFGGPGAAAHAQPVPTTPSVNARPKTAATRPSSRNLSGPFVSSNAGSGGAGSSTQSLHGGSGACTTPGRNGGAGGASARSRTGSPRQSALLGSARLGPGISTPKESWQLQNSGLSSAGVDGGYSSLWKTTPAATLRNAAPTVLSARPAGTPERPAPLHTPLAQQPYAVATPRDNASSAAEDRRRADARGSATPASAATPVPCLNDPQSARLGLSMRRGAPPSPVLPEGSGLHPSSGSAASTAPVVPELYVVKWVDYSSKYGVGYILSDKSVGVYFNDSTKIILEPNGHRFDYITRRTQDNNEHRTHHTLEDFPEDIRKKATLLKHFKNYMLTDTFERRDGASLGASHLAATVTRRGLEAPPVAPYVPGDAPFVKKWTQNRHAIMFQLSNRMVQVIFRDRTEAVLSSRSHMVTYVDANGTLSSYPISSALEVPNADLNRRLQFTRSMLENVLGARADSLAVPF